MGNKFLVKLIKTPEVTINVAYDSMPRGFRVQAQLKSGIMIGYANITLKGEKADLCDLFIRNDHQLWWPRRWPFFRRKHDFRSNGLGTQLLATAIRCCQELGCTRIDGWLHGDFRRLIVFYRRFGFKVSKGQITLILKESDSVGVLSPTNASQTTKELT